MSRGASFAALGLAIALVAGSFVALVGGVALGAWQPAGPSRPTTAPSGPATGVAQYGEFLDDVRAGRISNVFQEEDVLSVNALDGTYTVHLPPGDPDVFGDMQAAAEAGGVPMPGFGTNAGPNETPEPVSYSLFLEQVQAGRIYEVFQTDDLLEVNAVDGLKHVTVPPGVDVLDDIEAAAEAGGFPPPVYTKVPGKPA